MLNVDPTIPILTFLSVLGLDTTRRLVELSNSPAEVKMTLKDDPECGTMVGGRRNCVWDCEHTNTSIYFYQEPSCLLDCLSPSCLTLIMRDYKDYEGVCKGSYGARRHGWPRSDTDCEVSEKFPYEVERGLCREDTVEALVQQECINEVAGLPQDMFWTINHLVRSMCRREVIKNFLPRSVPACEDDCSNLLTADGVLAYQDPGCRSDCADGDLVETSCLSLLLMDYDNAGGVCQDSHADVDIGWPVSNSACVVENVYGSDPHHVAEGLCTAETEAALLTSDCIQQVWALEDERVREMAREMVRSLCKTDVWYNFDPNPVPLCSLDCSYSQGDIYEDPVCLTDCGDLTDQTCLSLLLTDFTQAGGVCAGSLAENYYNWTASTQSCVTDASDEYDYNYYYYNYNFGVDIVDGLCRPETEVALVQQHCINSVWSLPAAIRKNIAALISSLCRHQVADFFYPRPILDCEADCANTITDSGAVKYEDPAGCLADCPSVETNMISSPNYPDFYPNNASMEYVLIAPAGEIIQLSFTEFKLENHTNCFYDWVLITDGDGTELLPKTCGTEIPADVSSVTNVMAMSFHSDSSVTDKGFLAVLSASVTVVSLNKTRQITRRSVDVDPSENSRKEKNTKLNPIQYIDEYAGGLTIAQRPDFTETLGRYPWICSLRGRYNKDHYCGATVLSRPPGPLVIVTAAHCVHICKDDGDPLPNCCCDNVSEAECPPDSGIDCGDNPGVEVMTGEDVEIICGEWETGNYTAAQSGEDFNLVLNIVNITVHPDYNITRGANNSQYVFADLATIKVNNSLSSAEVSNLIPACLPVSHNSSHGVHAGWSSPPPQRFITEDHPAFDPFYRDFGKMWHYNMSLIPCQDPLQESLANPGQFYERSYYPPGTTCAREKNKQFCPTSGESGSPLMVQREDGRMCVDGINSFIKGMK